MSYAQYEQLRQAPFDLASAINEWRARHGPGDDEPHDDPWADVRDGDPAGGRAPVDFDAG